MSDELYDAPNQQAVRPDGSAPWDEGTGGAEPAEPAEPDAPEALELDALTKDQLIEEASARGVDVDQGMTKAQIRAALED